MRKICGECDGESEAAPNTFPLCPELDCDFIAATPKQWRKHLKFHEEEWWTITVEGYFEHIREIGARSGQGIYVPDFDNYLKQIRWCDKCSFPEDEECDMLPDVLESGGIGFLFESVKTVIAPSPSRDLQPSSPVTQD